MSNIDVQPAEKSAKKQKSKKLSKGSTIVLPIVALLMLIGLVGIPTVSEASKRHRHRWNWWSKGNDTAIKNSENSSSVTTSVNGSSSTSSVSSSTGGTSTSSVTPSTNPTTSAPAPVPSPVNTPTPVVSPVPSSTTTTNIPFLSNLVGYWKLNGNSTSSIGKDNGTPFGNITYVPGKFGLAAHFDGKSYIEIPDKDYFSPSTTGQKVTISYWLKPDNYNFSGINQGYVNLLGKSDWDNGANVEWEFRLYNENAFDSFSRSERMSFYAFNKGGGLGAGSGYNKSCPLNQWTNVVGVIDGSNTKLYLNGKLVDQDPLSGYNINMSNTSAPLRIGTSDKESYLQGSISNLMIYNRNLSDAEVSQLYNTDLSK